MATQVQWRRGTHAQVLAFTGAVGEIVVDLTQNRAVVQDGVTAGGWPHALLSEVIPSQIWKTPNAAFNLPAVSALGTLAVVTGTITNGDTVALTATGSFTGSPVTVTYNVVTGNTLNTIAAGLAALVNGNATLLAAGIRASVSGATVYLFSPTATANVWSRTNGSTETVTLTTDAAETLTVTGTPQTGAVLQVTITSAGITGSPLTLSYTALSTDTVATIATALAAAINGNTNLSGAGLVAGASSAGVVTVWLPTALAATWATSSSTTDTLTLTSANALTSLPAGTTVAFKALNTNTLTTPVANLDGLGAKTIQKAGAALFPGDLTTGQTYEMIYDGTYWQLFSAIARLINDSNSPGTTTYYGTNSGGTKGFFSFPSGNPLPPQGRLTLTSNTPVMTADSVAVTAIYYAPYVGSSVPLYSGSSWSNTVFSQLTLNLDSNSGHTGYQQSGKLFDLFVTSNGGVTTLCTGPAWTNSTTRSAAISLLNGIWTNTSSMTAKIDATSATITVSANQGTYVGTMYATANGQTSMQFRPAAANGGTNTMLGLYNAYNRVSTVSVCLDNLGDWTYSTATWRAADNSTSNRITFVDGLQQSNIAAEYAIFCAPNGGAQVISGVGINLDATTGAPTGLTGMQHSAGAVFQQGTTLVALDNYSPQLGLHYVQAMEFGASSVIYFYGSGAAALSDQDMVLRIRLDM